MFPLLALSKRTLLIAASVAAIAYGSQYYRVTGWNSLRLARIDEPNPAVNVSDLGWSNGLQSSNQIPNSSSNPSNPTSGSSNSSETWGSLNSLVGHKATASTVQPVDSPRIRIATFNLHAFNETKLRKQPVVETLARIVRQFDVIAIQHIDARQNDILPMLVDRINMSDRRYDYCIGPRVGAEGQKQQFAFVFDTARIETDREQLYTVSDPQNLIEFEPLVGWFRTKRARPDEAFTFSLVNVRIDPNNAERERAIIPDLVRSVKQDGRVEDDIILLGDFGSSSKQIASVPGIGLMPVLDEVATTVSGEWMLDNILIPARATDEFTGRAGVIDFLRQLNLTYDQAIQVSSHLPVWAEFYAFEGGVSR